MGLTVATRAGESIQVHYENLGLPQYFPDKIFIHLRSTSKLELRKAYAEDRASEKLKCPSGLNRACDTPGCGKLLKPVLPPFVGNCDWGPRLIAVY